MHSITNALSCASRSRTKREDTKLSLIKLKIPNRNDLRSLCCRNDRIWAFRRPSGSTRHTWNPRNVDNRKAHKRMGGTGQGLSKDPQ